MKYSDLKEIIKDENIKSIKEWRSWVIKNRAKYPDIPLRPETSYKDFEGYIVFLNNGKTKRKNYWTFQECVEHLKPFKFSVKGFNNYLKNNKNVLIPFRPEKIFRNEFISYNHFLSNNYISTKKNIFYEYNTAVEFLKNKNIKTVKQFRKLKKINNWTFLPSNPEKYYKDKFISYNIFLSNNSISNKKKKFFTYNEAKNYLKDKNLNSYKEYKNYIKYNNIDFLPKNPIDYYKMEYISNGDFLSNFNISSKNLHEQYNIVDLKKFIKDNEINDLIEYRQFLKNNEIKIFPYNPQSSLKNRGCNSVEDIFNRNKKQSNGENLIEKFLLKNGIIYSKQHRFEDCKNKRKLPFDFYLQEKNICIEYDGRQHFESVSYFGGESEFNKRLINDKIKTKFCENNGINIIRISYRDNIENVLENHLNS